MAAHDERTRYTVDGLAPNNPYFFRVRSYTPGQRRPAQ